MWEDDLAEPLLPLLLHACAEGEQAQSNLFVVVFDLVVGALLLAWYHCHHYYYYYHLYQPW